MNVYYYFLYHLQLFESLLSHVQFSKWLTGLTAFWEGRYPDVGGFAGVVPDLGMELVKALHHHCPVGLHDCHIGVGLHVLGHEVLHRVLEGNPVIEIQKHGVIIKELSGKFWRCFMFLCSLNKNIHCPIEKRKEEGSVKNMMTLCKVKCRDISPSYQTSFFCLNLICLIIICCSEKIIVWFNYDELKTYNFREKITSNCLIRFCFLRSVFFSYKEYGLNQ